VLKCTKEKANGNNKITNGLETCVLTSRRSTKHYFDTLSVTNVACLKNR
jgi:hypothetical protein